MSIHLDYNDLWPEYRPFLLVEAILSALLNQKLLCSFNYYGKYTSLKGQITFIIYLSCFGMGDCFKYKVTNTAIPSEPFSVHKKNIPTGLVTTVLHVTNWNGYLELMTFLSAT